MYTCIIILIIGFVYTVYNWYHAKPGFKAQDISVNLLLTLIFSVVFTTIISVCISFSYAICPPVVKNVDTAIYEIAGMQENTYCRGFVLGCNIKAREPKFYFKDKNNVLLAVNVKDVNIANNFKALYFCKTSHMMSRPSNWLWFGEIEDPNIKTVEHTLYLPKNYTIVNCETYD